MAFGGGCFWVLVGGEGALARGRGGGIDIIVSKGGGLAPPQRVLQGGEGASYFRAMRGRIEANRSRGVI